MSRTFELLRQAQRDQALLKQAHQVSAANSRNFELVHQTAKGQQLFETAPTPPLPHVAPAPSVSTASLRGGTFRLVQKLYLAPEAAAPRVLTFASVEPVSDHYRMCAYFAEVLAAQLQGSVCLVDANVAAPCLHRYFHQENVSGLAAAMAESGPVKDFTVRIGSSRLWLMPPGQSQDAKDWHALLSKHLGNRIAEMRAAFDCVLIAAPPATADAGSAFLGSVTDGVVLIVEPSLTPRQAAQELKDGIEASGGRVLGVVLHRRELTLRELATLHPNESLRAS